MSSCSQESYYPNKKNNCDYSKVNVDVQCGGVNNNHYCYHREEKTTGGCCCCLDKLRKIAQLFKDNRTQVFIFTENFNEPDGRYIYDIVNDIIYLSNTEDAKPSSFIQLCKVVSIVAERQYATEVDEIKEKIMNMSCERTQQKTSCGGSGVDDIINNIKKCTDSFPVVIPEMDQIDFFILILFIFGISNPIISTNNEFIFYYATFPWMQEAGYVIIPTCKIEGVGFVMLQCQSQQQIQAILKSENRNEIFKEMKGKTLDAMIKVVTENSQDTIKDV